MTHACPEATYTLEIKPER